MTENITQTPANMQLPPLNVAGIKIPNNIKVDIPSNYEKIKARHQEAVDAVSLGNKKQTQGSAKKTRLSGVMKFAIGSVVGVLGFFGIRRLIKK